jgi:membrane-associated phospholipid phosphatase
MYYPRWYTALLFAGAAGTAVARMGLEKHWSTDVLAGAGIGFFTGFFLSRLHMSAENEGFSIFPLAGKNSAGISAVYSY